MGRALKGSHYCEKHQGNHSHYAGHNCELCKAQEEIDRLRDALQYLVNAVEFSPASVVQRELLSAKAVLDNGGE